MVWINGLNLPFFNLIALITILVYISLLFDGNIRSRTITVITFMGIGILVEPLGAIMIYILSSSGSKSYNYYFIEALCSFIRVNMVFFICKLHSMKSIRIAKLPLEICGVVITIFSLAVINCCFTVFLALKSGNLISVIICIGIVLSVMLSYYLILYMIERFNSLLKKRYEDELYQKEMEHKETYYVEMEKRNEEVQNIRHNLKNKLYSLLYLLEKKDTEALVKQLNVFCAELETVAKDSYSENPFVDSVLRIKIGMAKANAVQTEVTVRIPKRIQMEYGDIGVLYGNLLDNAIEACLEAEENNRFIHLENKYIDGKLLLVIENGKKNVENKGLLTKKTDSYAHGRGIPSVKKVVEKYNGAVNFTDKGNCFEAVVLLYGIEAREEITKYYT